MPFRQKAAFVISSVVLILAVFFNLSISIKYVNGCSMLPTLHDGQVMMEMRQDVLGFPGIRGRPLQRGDIVVVRQIASWRETEPRSLIKRIIGVPNNQVAIGRRTVRINGRLLSEPYLDAQGMDNADYEYGGVFNGGDQFKDPGYSDRIVLSSDQYWVMGDNRMQSTDSRVFGPMRRDQIMERLIWALPLNIHTIIGRWSAGLLASAAGWACLIWLGVMIWLVCWPVGDELLE